MFKSDVVCLVVKNISFICIQKKNTKVHLEKVFLSNFIVLTYFEV